MSHPSPPTVSPPKPWRRTGLTGERPWASSLAVAGAALAGFALLTARAFEHGASAWDRDAFRQLYTDEATWIGGSTPGQSDPVLTAVMPAIHPLADSRALLVLVGAILVALVFLKRPRSAAFFAAAIAITALVPQLKQLVDRPSPFPLPHDPSFPSGHGTLSMAIAACVVILAPSGRWRWLAGTLGAALILAVGVAVIADSGHWPSDVVAGWCLALAWVALLYALAGPWLEGSADRAERVSAPQSHVPV
jgi:membrane-associated phospholipid phosphatase